MKNIARLFTKMQIAEILRDQKTVQINGVAATTQDMKVLEQAAKAGKVRVYGRITEGGNVSFRTEG